MKNRYKVILGIILFVTISFTVINFLRGKDNSASSNACGKVLTSIEELDNSSKIILRGKVKPKTGDIKLSFNYEQYPIEIIEVIKNTTTNQLNEKNAILLSVPTEVMELDRIETGEYLLFLNTLEIEDKLYYVTNSINNLYKLKSKKYVNVFGDLFRYITLEDKSLYQIKERDIVNLINKYEKSKSATSCSNPENEVSSLINDINSIEINPKSANGIIYTKDNNSEKIKEFIIAYNEAIPTDNSLGTTHNSEVVINYANGEKVFVLGGTQGFQTVIKNDNQFNIQGAKLWNYFKQLNKKLDS